MINMKNRNYVLNHTGLEAKILKFNTIYQNKFPRAWIILFEINEIEYNVEFDYNGDRYDNLHRVKLIENGHGCKIQIIRRSPNIPPITELHLISVSHYGVANFYLSTKHLGKTNSEQDKFHLKLVYLNKINT